MVYESELAHHGVLGQKWGVIRNRLKNGSAGKKSKAEKKEESVEAKKARIVKNMSAKEIYANRHLFSDAEIRNLQSRLSVEKQIKDLVPADVKKGQNFINQYKKTADNLDNIITSTEKTYKNLRKVQSFINSRMSANT